MADRAADGEVQGWLYNRPRLRESTQLLPGAISRNLWHLFLTTFIQLSIIGDERRLLAGTAHGARREVAERADAKGCPDMRIQGGTYKILKLSTT